MRSGHFLGLAVEQRGWHHRLELFPASACVSHRLVDIVGGGRFELTPGGLDSTKRLMALTLVDSLAESENLDCRWRDGKLRRMAEPAGRLVPAQRRGGGRLQEVGAARVLGGLSC